MGELGPSSFPDGTFQSPHHKAISQALTELPAPPASIRAQKWPYDPFSPPNRLLALIYKREMLTKGEMGGGGESRKKKEMRGKNEASRGKRGRGETLLSPPHRAGTPRGTDTHTHPRVPKPCWCGPIFQQPLQSCATASSGHLLSLPGDAPRLLSLTSCSSTSPTEGTSGFKQHQPHIFGGSAEYGALPG